MAAQGFQGLIDRLVATFPDTVWVLRPPTGGPWWETPIDITGALGTIAAALAAVAVAYFAHLERKRAERAETALEQEASRRKRAVESQVSAEAFALGAFLDNWLGRSPWDGEQVRPGVESPVFDHWAREFVARRSHMDARALSLMSWVQELQAPSQNALNQAYVTYHIASSAAADVAEGNLSPANRLIHMIFADHAARLCRDALKVLTASDLRSAVQGFVDEVGSDQLSRRRGELLKLTWNVHGPDK